MINIEGIQVDLTTGVNSLSNEWAVFTVEFEFDSRLLVCHVFNQPVYKGLKNLIRQILSINSKSIEQRRALLNSQYITVQIEKYDLTNKHEVLAYKYDLIKANRAYSPYGYNSFLKVGSSLEQSYADLLRRELLGQVDQEALRPLSSLRKESKKGRATKAVYSYDKSTGLLVGSYPSIKSAAAKTGVRASNITMCCKGRIKTAGNYAWSYTEWPLLDISKICDGRIKKRAALPKHDIAEKQQRFIAEN